MKTNRAILLIIGIAIILIMISASTKAMCPAKLSTEQLDSLVGYLIEDNVIENKDKEVTLNGLYLDMAPLVYQFYTVNNFKQVWTADENAELTSEVFRLLENAMQFGIDPEYFSVDYLRYIQKDIDKQCKLQKKAIRMTQFEFLMSHTVFQFYVLMDKGAHYYEKVNFYDTNDVYLQDLPKEVLQSVYKKDLVNNILNCHPNTKNYTNSVSIPEAAMIVQH